MDCCVTWTTYRNSISHIRIFYRFADCFDEGVMPRKGSPFTIDYGRRFANLTEALNFISKLNSESPCYKDIVLGSK